MIDQADRDYILSRVDFSRLRDARILITGGTGFVGTWMRTAGDDTAICYLNRDYYDNAGWQHIAWDYIIHLAPVLPEQVIRCALRCHARILFASSGAVLDDPLTNYGKDKKASEYALQASGLDVRIARLFTITGPGDYHAPAQMIKSALQNGVIRYNTSVTRSYLYGADMAIWLWRILLDGKPGGVYDVGSSIPVTMPWLALEVYKHFRKATLEPCDEPDARPYYVPGRAEETMSELGVQEYTPFDTAIKKTVKWIKEGSYDKN